MTYPQTLADTDSAFYGHKYAETTKLSTTDIAKLVREDVKKAKKAGKIAKEVKVSIRSESFAGGSAIRISVKEVPFSIYTKEYTEWLAAGNKGAEWEYSRGYGSTETQSKEATDLLALLKSFGNSYNRDNSDSQTDYFDVRFYLTVDLDWDLRAAQRKAAEQK